METICTGAVYIPIKTGISQFLFMIPSASGLLQILPRQTISNFMAQI